MQAHSFEPYAGTALGRHCLMQATIVKRQLTLFVIAHVLHGVHDNLHCLETIIIALMQALPYAGTALCRQCLGNCLMQALPYAGTALGRHCLMQATIVKRQLTLELFVIAHVLYGVHDNFCRLGNCLMQALPYAGAFI